MGLARNAQRSTQSASAVQLEFAKLVSQQQCSTLSLKTVMLSCLIVFHINLRIQTLFAINVKLGICMILMTRRLVLLVVKRCHIAKFVLLVSIDALNVRITGI